MTERERSEKPIDPQQSTGNHTRPGAADDKGADRFGGTRTGAQNVEPERSVDPGRRNDVDPPAS